MPEWMAAILFLVVVIGVPLGIFSIPLTLIWTHHRRKMEELRNQKQVRISEDVRAEFAAVRAEIKALRDTATQYDISFDTSLQQAERRIAALERQTSPADRTAHRSECLSRRTLNPKNELA